MKQEDIMKLEAAIAADYGNIAGMVVRKDGETVYERYFGGCTAESRLNVFSVTKSIISGSRWTGAALEASTSRSWNFFRSTRPSGAKRRSSASRSGTCSP